jgi:hypothetical protein
MYLKRKLIMDMIQNHDQSIDFKFEVNGEIVCSDFIRRISFVRDMDIRRIQEQIRKGDRFINIINIIM